MTVEGPKARWRPGPALSAFGRRALDLILPQTALDGSPAQSGGIPAETWSRIVFVEEPVCDGCGMPSEYRMIGRCPTCEARPHVFDRARAACLYDEHSREPILQLKHADRTDLAPLFARWLSRVGRPLLEQADVLVPVPLHRWRLLRRRYNQAAEVARRLSADTAVAWLPDALVRPRATGSQGGRTASGRRRNVAGAFAVPEGRRRLIEGRRILLVDDVLTTGATADACARALKKAGAVEVSLLVIARVKSRSLKTT